MDKRAITTVTLIGAIAAESALPAIYHDDDAIEPPNLHTHQEMPAPEYLRSAFTYVASGSSMSVGPLVRMPSNIRDIFVRVPGGDFNFPDDV